MAGVQQGGAGGGGLAVAVGLKPDEVEEGGVGWVGGVGVGGLGLCQRTGTIVPPYGLGRLLIRQISGETRRAKNSQSAKNHRRRSRRSNPSSLRRFDPAAASTALIASPASLAKKHRPIR